MPRGRQFSSPGIPPHPFCNALEPHRIFWQWECRSLCEIHSGMPVRAHCRGQAQKVTCDCLNRFGRAGKWKGWKPNRPDRPSLQPEVPQSAWQVQLPFLAARFDPRVTIYQFQQSIPCFNTNGNHIVPSPFKSNGMELKLSAIFDYYFQQEHKTSQSKCVYWDNDIHTGGVTAL